MRWLNFTTLAYGGRGINYFTYWGPRGAFYVDGKPSPLVKPVSALNAELLKLGPELLKLDSLAVYQTAPLPYGAEAIPANSPVQIIGAGRFVLGLFGKAGRPTAFMIVNRDYAHESEAVVKVLLRGSRLEELDRKTGKWATGEKVSRRRTVKIKLSPGDGRLFRVTGTAVRLSPPRDFEK
jgi:hypothetical protein